MKLSRGSLWIPGLLLLTALVAGSCSKSSSSSTPTAPGPGRELDSGNIAAGAQFAHQFKTAGVFNYHCIFHAPMIGTVTVLNDTISALAVPVSITSSTSAFTPATVRVNGTVTWTNNTAMTHTVTSN